MVNSTFFISKCANSLLYNRNLTAHALIVILLARLAPESWQLIV